MKGQTTLEKTSIPASKESEMMVLGCMLTDESSLTSGADGLEAYDFYYKEHQLIFEALKSPILIYNFSVRNKFPNLRSR